jgi:hypothetical protein
MQSGCHTDVIMLAWRCRNGMEPDVTEARALNGEAASKKPKKNKAKSLVLSIA